MKTIQKNEFIGTPEDYSRAEYMLLDRYGINARTIKTEELVNVSNLIMTIYRQRGKNENKSK